MAIPTMFNCSTRILVGRGGSILSSPEEEAHVRAKERDQAPLVLPGAAVPGMDEPATEEEPHCDSIIAQEEGDESEEFSPNCIDFYRSKTSHNTRPSVGVSLGRAEELSETQDDDEGTWTPPHGHRRRRRQRKKTEPSRPRWTERWREGEREAPRKERARDEMRERRRRRRILSEPCEPASSSDDCSRTSRAHHRWSTGPWTPSPGRRHRFRAPLLSPPPGFADRKAPLWESPSLDSLGSLLSQSPDERPSTGTHSSSTHTHQDNMESTQQVSTLVQVGSCSSCYTSEKSLTASSSHTPDSPSQTPDSPSQTPGSPSQSPDSLSQTPDSPSHTPDSPSHTPGSPRSYSLSDGTSESFTAPSDSQPRCLCPRFPGNAALSTSSTCSVEQSSTPVSSPCSNADSDSGCIRAKLSQRLGSAYVRSTVPFTGSGTGTEAETTSDSCYTLTRSFDGLDSISILSCLCGRQRADRTKDYYTETSSASQSLYSSTDRTCTSASSSYTVTRSFDSLCVEDIDSQNSAVVRATSDSQNSAVVRATLDSRTDSSSSTLKLRRGRRGDSSSSTVKGSFDSLSTGNDSDSSYVCMNAGSDACLTAGSDACLTAGSDACLSVTESYSDSQCSSGETVFRSDSSYNTVCRSFDSLCVNDDSDSVYVFMDGRGGSNSSTETARDSDSSLYSVERSLDSPYLRETPVALCTCPAETKTSQGSTGRSTDSLYQSENNADLYACIPAPGPFKSSLEIRTDSLYRSGNSTDLCAYNVERGAFKSSIEINTDSLYRSENSADLYASKEETGASQSSLERSTESLYRSRNSTDLCAYNAERGASQSSLERSTELLYRSRNSANLCTCHKEAGASQSSVEVYPNLYCSETDNGLTSTVTSAVTSDLSVSDSSPGCRSGGCDSDSLSTSAIAEWGSVSLDDRERSSSASTPSTCNHGNTSDCLCRAASSPGNGGVERDAAEALSRTLETGMPLDSPAHLATHLERVLKDLRGLVTQSDRRLVSPFFRELVREAGEERDREKRSANEGFLFHPQKLLQPRNMRYAEGQQYSLLQHIQNGSYGDVFSAVDHNTGFKCAAKKVPLCSFSWEEVGTWSGLSSPRVLQLFGAVREGPNIVLFMDLKTGSLAQLLRARGRLPEDLSLHYHIQVLEALEHLHRRHVLHLDIKVDNVLLSEDGRDCFLCDFGLSEMLDINGQAPRAFRGYGLRGTESHMAPEVAKGDARGAKADVWSSCCMLLHMLNGCHPWTRYYAHPLCLTIVSEEPPLREIPESCSPLTVQVFRAGLVKDPAERASASELKDKSREALRAVGGLTTAPTQPPIHPSAEPTKSPSPVLHPPVTSQLALPASPCGPDITSCSCSDSPRPLVHWLSSWRERAQEEEGSESEDGGRDSEEEEEEEEWKREKWEEEDSEEEEEERSDLESMRGKGSDWMEEEEEWEPFHRLQILYGPKHTHHRRPDSHAWTHTDHTESEEDSIASRKGPGLNSVPLPRPLRAQHRALTSPNTSEHRFHSSEKESEDWSDDLSSGVFSSYNSQTDRESFSVDWLVSTNQPPSCCIQGLGVDIWIEDFSGARFRIREKPQVKLGHIAMGISNQISERTFSLATLDGKLSRSDEEVQESGMWLQCVPARDDCPLWSWRIRDGQLEERR